MVRRAATLFLIVVVASGVAAAEPAVSPASGVGTNALGRGHIVVLKQIGIRGRVLLIQEDGTQSLSDGIDVQVLEPKENRVLYGIRTDPDGVFVLPLLDVGLYRLKAGALTVDLQVEDPVDAPGKIRLPKTILILMPEAMRGSESPAGKAGEGLADETSPK